MTIHDDLREVMGLLGKATDVRWLACGRLPGEADLWFEPYDDWCSYEDQLVRGALKAADAQAIAAAVNFLRQHGPALLAAAKYEEANPLGGPATMLEAAARRVRAGEDFHEVLADYGLLARQEGEDARDAARYRWLREWYLRGGKRSELDPLGHIRYTTPAIMDASIDAARSGGGG